jgi:hypothetical protein
MTEAAPPTLPAVLSLGAGVQSTTVALHLGESNMPTESIVAVLERICNLLDGVACRLSDLVDAQRAPRFYRPTMPAQMTAPAPVNRPVDLSQRFRRDVARAIYDALGDDDDATNGPSFDQLKDVGAASFYAAADAAFAVAVRAPEMPDASFLERAQRFQIHLRDERIDRLRAKLRELATIEDTDGKGCALCGGSWDHGDAESHIRGCDAELSA